MTNKMKLDEKLHPYQRINSKSEQRMKSNLNYFFRFLPILLFPSPSPCFILFYFFVFGTLKLSHISMAV